MKYTKLGNSQLRVSRICMGCMGFGDAANGQHSWTLDEEYSREIIKRGLELGINFFDTAIDLMLRCDANKIQRAFDNLLRNAVIYSYPDTEVNVTVVRQNDDVVIKFINHGDTISKENLERIFEQFYRLDISRSTSSGGAGLGLAISKRIIELHHGTITASSENDLIEFTVTLPAS